MMLPRSNSWQMPLCLYSPLLPLHMVNFWTLLGSQLTCLFPSLITINQGLPFYAFSGMGPFFLDSTYHNFYYKSTSQLIIKTFPHTTMRFRNFELIVYYNIPSAATYLIISKPWRNILNKWIYIITCHIPSILYSLSSVCNTRQCSVSFWPSSKTALT